MDEQRKHAILFAATLLCARKFLPLMETDHPDPSQEFLTEHFCLRQTGSDGVRSSKRIVCSKSSTSIGLRRRAASRGAEPGRWTLLRCCKPESGG